MNIINVLKMKYSEFDSQVREYLGKQMNKIGERFSSSTVYGQLLNVFNAATQNVLLYIDDSLNEQNIITAQRKKSIYGLASLSGYTPHTGTAASSSIKFNLKSNNEVFNGIIINNKTKLVSKFNGLNYNIILSTDSVIIDNININNSYKIVEGEFSKQQFTTTGGPLASVNFTYVGDIDMNYTNVYVNGDKYELRDSLYDCEPFSKTYVYKININGGIDIVFGNNIYGKSLNDGDSIMIEYLVCSGELGNIMIDDNKEFTFVEPLIDSYNGDSIDGNKIFDITLSNSNMSNGTYSETTEEVKNMVGFNSRIMALVSSQNYKMFIDRFSFVGYNRVWSEPGSLLINSLVIKKFNKLIQKGRDYFSLVENDFILSESQKECITESIEKSGMSLVGTIFKIVDPVIKKYYAQIFITMKPNINYNKKDIEIKVRDVIGDFFTNIKSDIYIPKSDIIQSIKNNITDIDGVNIYFLSEENEKNKIITSIDENIGFDNHGDIWLDNDLYFPVLMGGWNYENNNSLIHISDPLDIIIQ